MKTLKEYIEEGLRATYKNIPESPNKEVLSEEDYVATGLWHYSESEIEAIKSYAADKCQEQRKICAEKAEMWADEFGDYGIDRNSILNASQPKLK